MFYLQLISVLVLLLDAQQVNVMRPVNLVLPLSFVHLPSLHVLIITVSVHEISVAKSLRVLLLLCSVETSSDVVCHKKSVNSFLHVHVHGMLHYFVLMVPHVLLPMKNVPSHLVVLLVKSDVRVEYVEILLRSV